MSGAGDTYVGREQTLAKHFLLKSYLQALAFKILRFSDLTYVDGFSGPWKAKTEDFADTSFMIAIKALQDAQQRIFEDTGKCRKIRCFFSESDPDAYLQLQEAVKSFHHPEENFEIKTFGGEFEAAVPEIKRFVGNSFALIFIDPTGWTGYSFDTIKPLFVQRLCEVIINFMYGHVSRFINSGDPATVDSLNPILGGPGWQQRLDPTLTRGEAVLKLFRDTLKASGNFLHTVATKIDKPTENRPHFFMAYATKDYAGLKTFRDNEFKALQTHAANRAHAKSRKQEAKSGIADLFAKHEAQVQAATVGDDAASEMTKAAPKVLDLLRAGPLRFAAIAGIVMEFYRLRETNVKDLAVQLAREGKIEDTWSASGKKKPDEATVIRVKQA